MMSSYRAMDAGKLAIEYSPSCKSGGDYQPYIDRYRKLNAERR